MMNPVPTIPAGAQPLPSATAPVQFGANTVPLGAAPPLGMAAPVPLGGAQVPQGTEGQIAAPPGGVVGGVEEFDEEGEYDEEGYDDDYRGWWDFEYDCDPFYLFCEHPFFVQVLLGAWWAVDIGITTANYLGYMRKSDSRDLYGKRVDAYLAFVIISMVVFFAVAGMLWLWAVTRPVDYRDRKRKTLTGIILLWLLCDLPLWCINFSVLDDYGYIDPLQVAAFVTHSFAFAVFGVVTWVTYLLWVSNRIHKTCGGRGASSKEASSVHGSVHGANKSASDADFGFADNKQALDTEYLDAPPAQAGQANGWAAGAQAPVPLPLPELGLAPVYQTQQPIGMQGGMQMQGSPAYMGGGSPAFMGGMQQFPANDQGLF